jgi:hypothetical protein
MKEEKTMAVKVKIKNLAVGTEFNAGPATLRILEHFTDGTTLVITSGSIGDSPFNILPVVYERPEGFNLNDWRTSTIRKDLNENFLAAIKAAGKIDADRIVLTEWDLSDHQGGAGYGTSQDKIGLLSQKQFEKYAEQDLLELDDWWWLITPIAGYSYDARYVGTGGGLSYYHAYCGSYGVRPAFRLESEIEIVQLVEEVLRRIAEGTEGDEDDSDF